MDVKKDQEYLEEVPCLCGSVKNTEVLSVPPFKYVRCDVCSLVYLNPRLKQGTIKEFYTGGDSLTSVQTEHVKAEEQLYRERFEEELQALMKFKSGGKILDIGSAWGYFLNAAKTKGFEPFGVELSLAEAAFSKEHFGLEVFNGPLSLAGFPVRYFDVVTCWHVLEHIPNPAGELLEIKRIIKNDGLLVIDVPTEKELSVHITKAAVGTFSVKNPPDHIYYFSRKTLGEALDRAGFKIIKVTKHGGTGIVSRLSEKHSSGKSASFARKLAQITWLRKLAGKIFGRKDEITVYAVPKNLEPVMNLAPAYPAE